MIKNFEYAGKKIELPSFFPVIFPGEDSYKVEDKIRIIIPQITKNILINTYNFLKNPKLLKDKVLQSILKKSFVFVDSGGFLLTNFYHKNNKVKLIFDKLNVTWEDILKIQNNFAQIGNNIDFLNVNETKKFLPLNSKQIEKLIKINSHFIDLYSSVKKNFLFFPTVHAHNILILKAICKKLNRDIENYDGISVGGLVPLKNDWEKIISRIFYIRSNFKQTNIHVFGVGNPALLPILFSMGVSSTDSSSYLKYGLSLKYIDPSTLQIFGIDKLSEKLSCHCKICENFSKSDLISMQSMGKAFISIHNLYVYNKLAKLFRNKGNDILKELSNKNPLIKKGLKILRYIKRENKLI